MRDVWHDLRYAVRMLVKRRWYTLAAMTALALGIGANTAVFTLVNVVLLQGLPFDRSDRIVALGMQDAHSVSDLARRYPISFAAVHKHVGALERAGLVTKTRHGREQRVRGDASTLQTAHRLLDDLEALWHDRIDRIEQILAHPTERAPK